MPLIEPGSSTFFIMTSRSHIPPNSSYWAALKSLTVFQNACSRSAASDITTPFKGLSHSCGTRLPSIARQVLSSSPFAERRLVLLKFRNESARFAHIRGFETLLEQREGFRQQGEGRSTSVLCGHQAAQA